MARKGDFNRGDYLEAGYLPGDLKSINKFAKMPKDVDPFGKAPAGEVAPASDGGEMFAKFLALQGMAKDPNQAMANLMPSQLQGFY